MIMKRIIFALTTALMLCTLAQGKNRTVTEKDNEFMSENLLKVLRQQGF